MKRSKKKLAKCPSCKTERHRTEMEISLSIFEKQEKKTYKQHYKELGFDKLSYASFIDSSFEWACDLCLNTKKATLAVPDQQHTPDWPHLAYSDKQLTCYSCNTNFTFTKEEKKAWYESYHLPIYSEPSNCLACRRKIRQQRLENKTVSEILEKEEANISEEELKVVIDIYIAWDKMERAKYFQAALEKRTNNR